MNLSKNTNSLSAISCDLLSYYTKDLFQFYLDILSNTPQRWISNHLHRHRRSYDRKHDFITSFIDDHVTWQHQTKILFGKDGLMGIGRIAGSKNHIFPEFDIQLSFLRCLFHL